MVKKTPSLHTEIMVNGRDCGCSLICLKLLLSEFHKNRDFAIGCRLGDILVNHYMNDKSIDAEQKQSLVQKTHDRIMQNA